MVLKDTESNRFNDFGIAFFDTPSIIAYIESIRMCNKSYINPKDLKTKNMHKIDPISWNTFYGLSRFASDAKIELYKKMVKYSNQEKLLAGV